MQHRFLTRPRRAVAAALALTGGLLAVGTVPPAKAECMAVYVWVNIKDGDPDYLVEEPCAHNGGGRMVHPHWNNEQNHPSIPPGTPTGAGFDIWVVRPI